MFISSFSAPIAPAPVQLLSMDARFALSCAQIAASICKRHNPQTPCIRKRDSLKVFATDYAVQAALTASLLNTFPGDALLAEESVLALESAPDSFRAIADELAALNTLSTLKRISTITARRVWTLDPIDGTAALQAHDPGAQFAMGLALLNSNCMYPSVAALGLPRANSILIADGDTFHVFGERQSTTSSIKPATSWFASGPGAMKIRIEGRPPPEALCCGSLVKYAQVALGHADALVQTLLDGKARVWDHAAGVAVVIAAGGSVTDSNGNEIRIGRDGWIRAHVPIVASAPGQNHFELCEAVQEALLI